MSECDFFNDTFDNISFSTSGNCRQRKNLDVDIENIAITCQDKLIINNDEHLTNGKTRSCTPNLSSDESLFMDDCDENVNNNELPCDPSPIENKEAVENDRYCKDVKEPSSLENSLLKACQAAFSHSAVVRINSLEGSNISLDDTSFLRESQSEIDDRLLPDENSCRSLATPRTSITHTDSQALLEDDHDIETISGSHLCKLSSWGIPEGIIENYAKKNISTMFAWQANCLNNSRILQTNGNLVYSAPTSAGKTLVAEILAIKTVIERKKKVLFILPFVSVVREKMFHFQAIFGSSGVRVEGFMGSHNPPGGFKSVQVAICTIEKANGLINRLLEEGKLGDIGAVIVDEMHLIGDPSRGYLLELLLTKLKYMLAKKEDIQIQIIGMSATLPNLDLLAKWLDAELFVTNFRPIPLHELYITNGELYDNVTQLIRKLELLPDLESDTDNILQLCLETIEDSCSVLIFCPTKSWCESLALQIASAFWKLGTSKSDLGLMLREQLNSDAIAELIEQLKRSPVGLDAVLGKTVAFGVAFHHAGLTLDERDIVEMSFKSGTIRVLVATSTLSSGVNLPAKRVIIRTPMFHGKPIDSLTYRQMIGRAGRMGKDTSGESILICQPRDCYVAQDLLSANLNPIESCLEGAGKLKRALLEVIASGVAVTPQDVQLFANATLLASSERMAENPLEESLAFLQRNDFVRLSEVAQGQCEYRPTSLAKACLASSMPPDEGLALFAEVEKARECFVLENELHIIYLVTPYSACNQWGNLDWMLFFQLWEKLPASMRRVGELVGVRDFYIINGTRGKVDTSTAQTHHKLVVHKRFFIALALQDLVSEVPLNVVAAKFHCNRGMLQSLQQSAATFAGMLTTFSRQLGWSSIELLVAQFQDRLQFGVNRDLLDLMRLSILNGQRARALFNGGIETLAQLANATVADVEVILMKSAPFESGKREGESELEARKRKQLRSVWITGREGVSEGEAAQMLIADAREYLQLEMGLVEVKWASEHNHDPSKPTGEHSISNQSLCDRTISRNDSGLDIENVSFAENAPTAPKPDEENGIKEDLIANSQEEPKNGHKRNLDISPQSFANQTPTKRKKIQRLNRRMHKLSNNVFDLMDLDDINIIDILCANENMFQIFYNDLAKQKIFSLSVACNKYSANKPIIGLNVGNIDSLKPTDSFVHKYRKIEGIAFSWCENIVYYLQLQNIDETITIKVLQHLQTIFNQEDIHVRIFDAKEQIKLLKLCFNLNILSIVQDPKVGDWLLHADEREKNLQSLTLNYFPEGIGLCQLAGTSNSLGSIGIDVFNTTDARIRAGVEAVVCLHLTEVVKDALLKYPHLSEVYDTEMECLLQLAQMELHGFGVDSKKLQELSDNIKAHTLRLEKEAYSLAGRHFCFTSRADVSKVLGMQRKYGQTCSTSKKVLEQQTSPIATLILQWRKLNNTLTKIIYPLFREVHNGRIYCSSLIYNCTGRISMHEPNIQNVPKNFQANDETIRCRSAFVAQEGMLLVSADYCQLELRLLSHFAQDPVLCAIMKSDGDVFKSIAAEWHNIDELNVNDTQRQWAKQICYGIIYGMGKRALAEKLCTSTEEAEEFMNSFHESYPSIKQFIKETVQNCVCLGYVTTLVGRRRYLPNINHENAAVKSQAERQAVNTAIQGSAADIAKRAIISIEKEEFPENGRPQLVLHLHDELLYEVPSEHMLTVANILKKKMETTVNLSVPFPVKLKSGRNWGEMTELMI